MKLNSERIDENEFRKKGWNKVMDDAEVQMEVTIATNKINSTLNPIRQNNIWRWGPPNQH